MSLKIQTQVRSLPYKEQSLFELGKQFAKSVGTLIFTDLSGKITVCINPLLTVEAREHEFRLMVGVHSVKLRSDGLKSIQDVLDELYRFSPDIQLFGGFSYESFSMLESVTLHKAVDFYCLPDVLFSLFEEVHRIDPSIKVHTVYESSVQFGEQPMSAHLKSYGKSASPAVSWTHFEDFPATDVESLLSKRDYIKRVNDVKSAIIEGEIYQASFTHVFRKKNITDSWLHFCEQFSVNPSNYYVYWNLGGIQICCTSPELFLKLDRGELVARPIKGTLRRVGHHSNELVSSSKNAAELSMIVDLFRNDFNRVCLSGSVEVRSHKEILELQNVFHMFSEIRGLVDPSISTIEIIEAIFPSGSISGCPKIRAFEVLQELEVCRRSFYTGSIGWISKDQINLNVGIRTLFFLKDWIHFHVGGGIVFDSTGEEEYQETLYKAQPFFQSMGNP